MKIFIIIASPTLANAAIMLNLVKESQGVDSKGHKTQSCGEDFEQALGMPKCAFVLSTVSRLLEPSVVSRGEEESAEPNETESVTTINDNLEQEFSDLSFVTRFSSKNKEPILTVMQ